MSPRAAWRLETLGFDVYDYTAGKQDWLACGLDYEGHATLAGDHLTTDIATCSLTEELGEVRNRLEASRFGMMVVVNAEKIVLGRLNRSALDADDHTQVSELMHEGPTTIRPSEPLTAISQRMHQADVQAVLVTRSDGSLLGLLEHDIAQQAADQADPPSR